MRKENRSQESGGKRGEINLTLEVTHFYLGLHPAVDIALITLGIPLSEKVGLKALYVCPGCSNHTYNNNMVNRYNTLIKFQAKIFTK
jgi:hypothetical protein